MPWNLSIALTLATTGPSTTFHSVLSPIGKVFRFPSDDGLHVHRRSAGPHHHPDRSAGPTRFVNASFMLLNTEECFWHSNCVGAERHSEVRNVSYSGARLPRRNDHAVVVARRSVYPPTPAECISDADVIGDQDNREIRFIRCLMLRVAHYHTNVRKEINYWGSC